jgi:hypothetical protein
MYDQNGVWNPNANPILSFGLPAAMPAQVPAPQRSLVPQANVVPTNAAINPEIPGGPASTQGWFGKIGGLEGLASIADGLASLGQVYGAIQGVKMAKKQLDFSERAYNTNLANSTQSYNTALEDRARSRFHTEGRASEVDSYLAKHSL